MRAAVHEALNDEAGPIEMIGETDFIDPPDAGLADLRPELRLLVTAWRLQRRLDDLSARIDRARDALSTR